MLYSNKRPLAIIKPVKLTSNRVSDELFLIEYGLFAGKPGMLDLKGKAKWNTWNEKKGMSQDEAKEKYIAFVDFLMEQYKE